MAAVTPPPALSSSSPQPRRPALSPSTTTTTAQQQQQQQQQHPSLPPALQHLRAHDLATGTGSYSHVQPVLRQTFAALMDAAAAAHEQMGALQARVARQEERRRQDSEAGAVALRTVRTLLDGLRAEFAPRLEGLEARCAALGEEVKGQRQRREEGARMAEAALARRVELLQGEVGRLCRALQAKADGAEVEAALRLRVSKASFAKRVEALLLHGEGEKEKEKGKGAAEGGKPATTPLVAGLRRRLEEQERAVRRLGKEVAAVRAHVVGGRGEEKEEGLAGVLRGLQAVLEHQGKRMQRAEKEVAGLKKKVVRELALVEGRVEERVLGGGEGGRGIAPVVEESLKAFEQEIVKELDARDGELRRQLEGTLKLLHEREAAAEAAAAATTAAGGGGGSGGALPRPFSSRGSTGVVSGPPLAPLDTAAVMQAVAAGRGTRGPLTPDPTRSRCGTTCGHHHHPQATMPAAAGVVAPASSLSRSQGQPPPGPVGGRETTSPSFSSFQRSGATASASRPSAGAVLPGDADSSSLRSVASLVGGGGGYMPTIWCGTGAAGLGEEEEETAPGGAGGGSQQQQLETLRREKQMLRSRIQQGLMTLSQASSPGRSAAAPPQQPPHTHTLGSGGDDRGGEGRGGLQQGGAQGSAGSMV